MQTKIEKINITPDKSIFPKLGQAGYSVSEALAELLDNSIDARENIVEIEIKIDSKNERITVEDNGIGMSKKQATESVILGRSNKKEGQLGQFGLGLKTACMSLGKKFTVETTSAGNDELYTVTFDEDEFLKTSSWSDLEISIKKGIEKQKSGTKLTIEKLRIEFYPNLIGLVKKHLSERFAPFIKNKETIITVNGSIIVPDDLKMIEQSKKDFTIDLSNGRQIHGWAGILEVGSVEKSGFNLYRHNRLIQAHAKLGYTYHPSKMWIAGEVHMNPLPVTHNKREFITTDPLYVEFFDKFQEILKPLLLEAQNKHREERIKDLPSEVKETLKDNLLEAMNKVEDFKELAFPDQKEIRKRSDSDEGILSDKEIRDQSDKVAESGQESEDDIKNQGRNPKKTIPKKVRFITIAGQKYKFDYEWGALEEDIPKTSYLDREQGAIKVILNSKYRILNVIKPSIFYVALYVIEGIVEVFLKENNKSLDKLVAMRDKTAKVLADVISEDMEEQNIEKDSQILETQNFLLQSRAGSNENSNKLTDREKDILHLRLEEGLTLEKIARQVKLTRERVRQIVSSAIKKVNNIGVNNLENTGVSVISVGESSGKIIDSIAELYNTNISELLSESRNAKLVLPRHLIMYLLREKLSMSFPAIAKIMHRKDHTTIMHAYSRIGKLITDGKMAID